MLKSKNTFFFYIAAPSIILIGFINLYPFFRGILYSFQKGNLFKIKGFNGINNYIHLSEIYLFQDALYFSLLFCFFGVTLSYLIGLGLALFFNLEFPFKSLLRATILLPWVVPPIVVAVSWKWILVGYYSDLLNVFLSNYGFDKIYFLGDDNWAIFTVIIVKIWKSFPFMMISLLAGLQTIPKDIIEASYIDGASSIQRFIFITIPYIKKISIICCILMIIWCFNDFETIWLMTRGGPADSTNNLILLAYKYTFIKNNVGIGSAIAVIAMTIMMLISLYMLYIDKKTVNPND